MVGSDTYSWSFERVSQERSISSGTSKESLTDPVYEFRDWYPVLCAGSWAIE